MPTHTLDPELKSHRLHAGSALSVCVYSKAAARHAVRIAIQRHSNAIPSGLEELENSSVAWSGVAGWNRWNWTWNGIAIPSLELEWRGVEQTSEFEAMEWRGVTPGAAFRIGTGLRNSNCNSVGVAWRGPRHRWGIGAELRQSRAILGAWAWRGCQIYLERFM